MARSKKDFDLIIVGGGPAGLTLACLLGTKDFSVLCIDREDIPKTLRAGFDGRTTAISYGSHLVLKDAGVWDLLEPLSCPIENIKILDSASPVLLNFLSEEVENRAFGHIIENRDFRACLYQRAAQLKTVTHLTGADVTAIDTSDDKAFITTKDGQRFSAQLIVGADGRNSVIRNYLGITTHGWNYEQTAIVCPVQHEQPHHNAAVEHFRSEGPFAILPMRDDEKGRHRSALVWTVHGKDSKNLIEADEEIFNAAIAARFPADYGAVKALPGRAAYPLSLQHAHSYKGPRIALIAEAAHAMHPIAGQGLNMGMRDIAALSEILTEARDEGKDLGSDEILTRYQRARRFDTMLMMAATDTLNKLFSNNLPFLGGLRRMGVRMVSRIPSAKRFFMHQAMGLGIDPASRRRS